MLLRNRTFSPKYIFFALHFLYSSSRLSLEKGIPAFISISKENTYTKEVYAYCRALYIYRIISIKKVGKHSVSTTFGDTMVYPQACKFLKLKTNIIHLPYEKM